MKKNRFFAGCLFALGLAALFWGTLIGTAFALFNW